MVLHKAPAFRFRENSKERRNKKNKNNSGAFGDYHGAIPSKEEEREKIGDGLLLGDPWILRWIFWRLSTTSSPDFAAGR